MKPEKITIIIANPTKPVAKKLIKEDVWGEYGNPMSRGMIIARSGDTCPIWKDKIPYKSVTAVCKPEQVDEVIYLVRIRTWLEQRQKTKGIKK